MEVHIVKIRPLQLLQLAMHSQEMIDGIEMSIHIILVRHRVTQPHTEDRQAKEVTKQQTGLSGERFSLFICKGSIEAIFLGMSGGYVS